MKCAFNLLSTASLNIVLFTLLMRTMFWTYDQVDFQEMSYITGMVIITWNHVKLAVWSYWTQEMEF